MSPEPGGSFLEGRIMMSHLQPLLSWARGSCPSYDHRVPTPALHCLHPCFFYAYWCKYLEAFSFLQLNQYLMFLSSQKGPGHRWNHWDEPLAVSREGLGQSQQSSQSSQRVARWAGSEWREILKLMGKVGVGRHQTMSAKISLFKGKSCERWLQARSSGALSWQSQLICQQLRKPWLYF